MIFQDDNPSGIDIKPAQKTEDENETELDVKPVFKHPEIVPLPIELLENPLFEENGDNFKDVSVKQENPGKTLLKVQLQWFPSISISDISMLIFCPVLLSL